MEFTVLSSEPRQRRQEIGCVIVVLIAIVAFCTTYSIRARDAIHEATTLCELAKPGAKLVIKPIVPMS